jgi:hypothetical protein
MKRILLALGISLVLCFSAVAQFNGCSTGACPSTFGAGIGPGGGSTPTFGPAPFLGNVVTRTMVANDFSPSITSMMVRHAFFVRDNVSSLAPVISNFWVGSPTSFVETVLSGTTTVRASIEFPAGTCTPVTFSGSTTGTTTAAFLKADGAAINIPKGSEAFLRLFLSNPSGLAFNFWSVGTSTQPGIFPGDNFNFQTATDQTATCGTITNTAGWTGTTNVGPIAILANTRQPSVYEIGDSRQVGAGDTYNASGDLGELSRSIGPAFGYINAGSEGDSAVDWMASHAIRAQFAQWASHVIIQYGTNDITLNQTSAQLVANRASIRTLLGLPTFETTIPVETSSTDNFVDASQTPINNPAIRQAFNVTVRAGTAGMLGFFDIASVTDTNLTAPLWKFDGVTPHLWTIEGIHETQFGNLAILSAGVVNTSRIHRP